MDISMNPDDYRCAEYNGFSLGREYEIYQLYNWFGERTTKELVFNALDEMRYYGSDIVYFSRAGVAIYKYGYR